MKAVYSILATLSLLAAQAGQLALAQSDALVTKRDSVLRAGPSDSYAAVAPLPQQTPITRLPARQGPWMQVQTGSGASGWVHMFDVTTASAQASAGSSATGALRGLTSFLNRGSSRAGNTTTATATTGIRGLGAEDINNAQPDLQAVASVEGQRLDATQARRFAAEAQLQARKVDALPVPGAPAAAPEGAMK